jgi:hypothetical protein
MQNGTGRRPFWGAVQMPLLHGYKDPFRPRFAVSYEADQTHASLGLYRGYVLAAGSVRLGSPGSLIVQLRHLPGHARTVYRADGGVARAGVLVR